MLVDRARRSSFVTTGCRPPDEVERRFKLRALTKRRYLFDEDLSHPAAFRSSPRTSHGRSLMKDHLPAPINPLPDRTPQRSTLISRGRDPADGAVRHQRVILREP